MADPADDDGTPSILGPATVGVPELRAWWASTGRGQPERLALDIDDLIALYVTEGDTEGVRGDLAFAQAVLETGGFTNRDTTINNYAGIGHYDTAPAGLAFPDPITGVRAHIQLLKKYAAGNSAPLATPDVAPDAGAAATTWGGLAGTWASSPVYWQSLNAIWQAMTTHAGAAQVPAPAQAASLGCADLLVEVAGGYALPVARRWYDQHPEWFSRPHHDYPAIDLPVPVGTALYAITDGVIVATPTGGRCGTGVVLNGDDHAQYTYCHGRTASTTVRAGDRVRAGQHLLDSASTGNSTGPHLHLAILAAGQQRCPGPLLVAIANQQPIPPAGLPASGCTS
ncbi:MAG: hypothetical protein D6683_05065 [Actinomyces sp.]|nr:MAG: hypothetical protein D6683_05065 [Actinomyces sp.]